MGETIFTKIIKGKIKSYKVAEDLFNIAFLDTSPIKKGHVLVIPKKEIDKIFDLNFNEFISLMGFSYKVSKAIEKIIPNKRISLIVLGFDIPHAHIHLIPINKESDVNFSNPRIFMSKYEFKKLAFDIQKEFIKL